MTLTPLTESFTLRIPTLIDHRMDAVSALPGHLKRMACKKPLIITDPGIKGSGLVERLVAHLDGYSFAVVDDVEPDPTIDYVQSRSTVIAEHGADALIALGGGSVIDTAKGIRVLHALGGSLRDYKGPSGRLPERFDIPLIAVSTTAGTGSQVARGAVFTDDENETKFPVIGDAIFPEVALNDPAMTATAPASVTAHSGIDALVHSIESFVSREANALSDAMNRQSIEWIAEHLPRAVRNGSDLVSRDKMLLASTVAGICFGMTRLGLAHSLQMPICAKYHLPHGLVVGVLLPYVMRFNLAAAAGKFAALAPAFGIDSAEATDLERASAVIDAIRELNDLIGVPAGLAAIGVRASDVPDIARIAHASLQTKYNPVEANRQDIEGLLHDALRD